MQTRARKRLELPHVSTVRHETDGSPHDRFDYPQFIIISGGIYREVFLDQQGTAAHGVPFTALLINH